MLDFADNIGSRVIRLTAKVADKDNNKRSNHEQGRTRRSNGRQSRR